ncbi:hypothetical protein EV121DRAFT_287134 [Schizophyllum commune]
MAPKPTLARIRRSKASERRMLSVLCILGFILATVSVVGAYDSNPIYVTICGEAGALLSLCVGLLQLFPAKQDPESDIELGSAHRDSRASSVPDDRDDERLLRETSNTALPAYRRGPSPSPTRSNAFLRRRNRRRRSSSSASTPDITIQPPSRPSSSNSFADHAQDMDEEMASPYDAGIPLDFDSIPRAISPSRGRRKTKGTPALGLSVIEHELAVGNIARMKEVAENSDMEKRNRERANEWNRMLSPAEAETHDASGVLRKSPGWVNTSRTLPPRIARKRELHAASNTSSANGGDVPYPGSGSDSESDIVPARRVGNHFHDPFLGEDDDLTPEYPILQSPSDPSIIQRTADVAPEDIVGVEQQRTAIDGEPCIDVSHLPQRSPPSPLRSFLVKTSLPCEPSVPHPLPIALLQEGATDSDSGVASRSTISSSTVTSSRPLSPLGDLVWQGPYSDVTIRVIPADF